MKPCILASFCCALLISGPASSQSVDTRGWRSESNRTWGFSLAVPPGWVTLDMPLGDIRLTVRRDLPGGGKLMCQVNVRPLPDADGLTQTEINKFIVKKGPPSPQEVTEASRGSGISATFYSSELRLVNNFPAYIYDSSFQIRMDNGIRYTRMMSESLYAVGRSFGVNCSAGVEASGVDRAVADRLFDANLPLFRAVLGSVVIFPLETR